MELQKRVRNIRKKCANKKVSFNFGSREIIVSKQYSSVTFDEIMFARLWYENWLNGKLPKELPPGETARIIVQRMLDEVSFIPKEEGVFILSISGPNAWTIRREDNFPLTIHG